MAVHILAEDLVRLRRPVYAGEGADRRVVDARDVILVRYWGDAVEVVDGPSGEEALDDEECEFVEVQIETPFDPAGRRAAIKKRKASGRFVPPAFRDDKGRTLAVTFIDVQQGDATLIRTPAGRSVLVDGGEESFVARMLAATFPHTTANQPFVLDALVVTHGDADHYSGLFELADAREFSDRFAHKRIHARVDRYFHNGLVKTGGSGSSAFGPRVREEVVGPDNYWITELWQDPRSAPKRSNAFDTWGQKLTTLLAEDQSRTSPVAGEQLPVVRRLAYGDDDAFDFLRSEGVDIRVVAPHLDTFDGQPALPFLRHEGSLSDSHTINGHSVVLKLVFNKVSVMLGGDLNEEGGSRLLERLDADPNAPSLRSEVLKVPHHGSAEFHPEFLERVSAVVSVVSSGDENEVKEYIHPRANLMGALGRYARPNAPALVFSTELAAFFKAEGFVQPAYRDGDTVRIALNADAFFAFQRLNFGRINLRTDGERVVVASESAVDGIKEVYAFSVDSDGNITSQNVSML